MLRMILHTPRRKVNTPPPEHQQTQVQPQLLKRATTTDQPDEGSDDSDVDSNPMTDDLPPLDDASATELEPWVDWIQRSTHEAEERMKKAGLEDWTVMQKRRKWRWAQKLATNTATTWTTIALESDPTQNTQQHTKRQTGRPRLRWTDDINQYLRSLMLLDDPTQRNQSDDDAQHDDTNNPNDNDNTNNNINDNGNFKDHFQRRNDWIELAREEQIWKELEDGYVSQP